MQKGEGTVGAFVSRAPGVLDWIF